VTARPEREADGIACLAPHEIGLGRYDPDRTVLIIDANPFLTGGQEFQAGRCSMFVGRPLTPTDAPSPTTSLAPAWPS
jgi:hypothetical protein